MSSIEELLKFAEKNGRAPNAQESWEIAGAVMQDFMSKLEGAVIPEKNDLPFLAAVHTLIAEALKATLDNDGKKMYENALRNSHTISILTSVKGEEAQE